MTERKAQVLGLARALFNRDGFGTTSFRAIAAGLKMSPGHLHYHFKTKEALLTALFEAIVLETEGRFGPGIDFRALPAEWLRLQRSYAFFFRELPAILADYPAVRRRYRAIGRKRIEELTVLITALSASGIVIVEPEPGFFRRWAELLWHHCNSALMAVSDGDPESMLEVLILPMLSETGRGFRARFDGV